MVGWIFAVLVVGIVLGLFAPVFVRRVRQPTKEELNRWFVQLTDEVALERIFACAFVAHTQSELDEDDAFLFGIKTAFDADNRWGPARTKALRAIGYAHSRLADPDTRRNYLGWKQWKMDGGD